MRGRVRSLAGWLAACVAGLVVSGCTAVSWSDGRGGLHHAGLVWVQERALEEGLQVTRTAVGLDVRWAGAWPGVTLGVHRSRVVIPTLVQIDTLAALGPAVARWSAGHALEPGAAAPSRAPPDANADASPRALADDAAPPRIERPPAARGALPLLARGVPARDAVLAAWWVLGLDASGTPGGGTAALGFHSGRHLIGRALQPGHVLVDTRADGVRTSTVLWRLPVLAALEPASAPLAPASRAAAPTAPPAPAPPPSSNASTDPSPREDPP